MTHNFGRVTRTYCCSICGSELTNGFDCELVDRNNVLTAVCPRGHQLRTEWPIGETMPDIPIKSDLSVEREL